MDWTYLPAVLFLIYQVGYVSGQSGHFLECNWVISRNCTLYHHSELCGTDGKSYMNMCFFAKAYCSDKNIHIRHEGHCNGVDPDPGMVTNLPPFYTGVEAVQEFFCFQLSHVDCDSKPDEICASDNNTYLNSCEYEKQKCTHRGLHLRYFGHCVVSLGNSKSSYCVHK